jgi:hypothetical protein
MSVRRAASGVGTLRQGRLPRRGASLRVLLQQRHELRQAACRQARQLVPAAALARRGRARRRFLLQQPRGLGRRAVRTKGPHAPAALCLGALLLPEVQGGRPATAGLLHDLDLGLLHS